LGYKPQLDQPKLAKVKVNQADRFGLVHTVDADCDFDADFNSPVRLMPILLAAE
jgi:hypothetical protein